MTTENNDTQKLMGPAEVSKYLGMTERTILQWSQQGKLPAFKVGSVWRYRRAEIDRWLESSRSGPSVDEVQPLTPYIEPPRSKWRIRKDEEEVDKAMFEACSTYIEATINTVGRDTFVVEQFEDRFGKSLVDDVIKALKKEKKISESEHEGLNSEKVRVITKRS